MDIFLDQKSLGIPFQEALGNWFRMFPGIRKPCELAYSIFASERFFLHIEFLSWLQALDGLHRGLPSHLAPIQHQKGKNPSLLERLSALLQTLPPELRRVIVNADEVPKAWVKSRDYFTHWADDLQEHALTNAGIFEANIRLKHLTVILLLGAAGIPPETILRAYEGTSDFARELGFQNAASARRRDPNLKTGLIMAVRPATLTPSIPGTQASGRLVPDEGEGSPESGSEGGPRENLEGKN